MLRNNGIGFLNGSTFFHEAINEITIVLLQFIYVLLCRDPVAPGNVVNDLHQAFVVPDNADSTMMVGSFWEVTSDTIWCILSGVPTEVPPNFMIFIRRKFRSAKIGLRYLSNKAFNSRSRPEASASCEGRKITFRSAENFFTRSSVSLP